ncbi:MAG: TonB-dependent receptor [Bacteroidetes bacterium]|jgi:outer membrane receptor for ferrienterochelin and colicin|nr:TonB-dependent receptor [Bacteroidota bacterium]
MKKTQMKLLLAVILFLGFTVLKAQHSEEIQGKVIVQGTDDEPVTGANVYWPGTTVGTITDKQGRFEIPHLHGKTQLVISYIGYRKDTVDVNSTDNLEISLKKSVDIDEVKVEHRSKSTQIGMLDARKTETVTEDELFKAACCNLSESFETNPSVDVSFTDAVTGTRQIQMLGLAGQYSQITRENMPDIRGLSTIHGLTYIPGTWIESIQLNKGAGSVVNGFESITGQINTEIRKPETADQVFLNGYVNEMGRLEGNANLAHRFNDKWSSMLMLHGKNNTIKHDENNDGFLDHPLGNNLIALNRWKYTGDQGMRMQFGLKATYLDRFGGEEDFNPEDRGDGNELWGMEQNTKRFEGWAKIGYVNPEKPYQSAGLQLFAASHEQDSYFGLREYKASQQTGYGNFIFNSIIGNTNHSYKTGISFQYDDYQESLNENEYDRKEIIPGAFFEYTYSYQEVFDAVAGIRADYHNLYGTFTTPRLHLRYAPAEKSVIRASVGRGLRTANIIAENIGLLASSREFIIESNDEDLPFGLEPEIAWNYGLNFTQKFRLDYREGSIALDFYRTDFMNQVVVDLDQNTRQAMFYNLEGESYSNSLQAQVDYEVINHLDVRMAYRWYDVKTTFRDGLKDMPLTAQHRAFVNLGYETRSYWKFDYTINWQGSKRIPNTTDNPVAFQLDERSPAFYLMNAQVTKSWLEKFEIYAGVENLLNFTQDDPVLSASEPFGDYFDSSMIWGPVFGRKLYLGFRYRLK